MSEDLGYIYCITSESEPGICKVGCVWKEGRTPADRLKDANSCTWHIPDFKLNFAKKVKNPMEKERQLHGLLEQFTERIHPGREFFRVSPEKLHYMFRLIEGEAWIQASIISDANSEDSERGCRIMSKCLRNGQRIKHTIGSDEWIGVYNSNKILYNNVEYSSLSAFSIKHHDACETGRKTANGWNECKCEIDNVWVSTTSLSELPEL